MSSRKSLSPEDILEFKISNFNRVASVVGGFLTVFGLVSYLLKEKFYLGEAFVSTIAGIIFSPHATNLIRPLEYANGDERTLESITLYFSRMVLGIQLTIAGIQLPSRYLKKEWKSLSLLIGPGMCAMWITTSLLVWALVPDIPFVYALAVGSCVTPTDPVLSNSIVKGKFADKNIPKELQNIIIAESGLNDGLGYPFLFIALYLIKYTHDGGLGQSGGAGKAMGYWFGITWGYEIILSTLYGIVVGWIFKEALHWAEKKKYVDRESFLVFAVSLALFIVGTLGMIGSDDVLACFVAGNAFTWDDWFRVETQDDSFQPTIDMLLNVSIFAWYGAVCPWSSFLHNNVIPIYRLIFIGVLVLLFRRLPIVLAMHKQIHQIYGIRHALFVGYFGPIGVSAIFYLYTSREYLAQIQYQGHERADAERLSEIFNVVVWFMIICSIVAHGLSIPLGKLGVWLPRTMSRVLSEHSLSREGGRSSGARSDPILPFRVQRSGTSEGSQPSAPQAKEVSNEESSTDKQSPDPAEPPATPPAPSRPVFRIGGSSIKEYPGNPEVDKDTHDDSDEAPSEARQRHHVRPGGLAPGDATPNLPGTPARSIRFDSSPERARPAAAGAASGTSPSGGRGRLGKGPTW